MSAPKQWIVTGTSLIVEADTEAEAVDRAQEMSGWSWEAHEVADLDTASSASRQHHIETGRHLTRAEVLEYNPHLADEQEAGQ